MPKDTNVKNDPPRSKAGVTTLLGTSAAPPIIIGGAHAGSVQCDTCGLYLPRSATHIDVTAHICFRGFSVSISAAGQLSLA